MFKVGKCRIHKLKVVFKLQFRATQVGTPGTKLMVSLVPEDVGRPSVRLGKVVVGEDGHCTWEDPVYETVKLSRETKSGKVHDKFYHFVVATGPSKNGFIGEILFNFADFLDAAAPVTVWQPIHGSNSDAALHVTIQNTQGGEDPRELGREIEQNGEWTVESQDMSLRSQLSNSTTEDRNSNHNSIEDDCWNTILSRDDEKSRANYNEQTSFNSLSNQKSVLDPTRRNSSNNSRQDMKMYLESSSSEPSPIWNSFSQRKMPNIARENSQGEGPLKMDWPPADDMVSLTRNSDDKVTGHCGTLPDASTEQLKREILPLERQAEVMELELQTLRKQLVKETKRGQELLRQVSSLKDENEALIIESEKSSSSKNEKGHGGEAPWAKETNSVDSNDRLRELKEELAHLKSVNKMLRRKLGKTQDSNSKLILLVKNLEDTLDKREKELTQLSIQLRKSKKSEELEFQNTDSHKKNGVEENQAFTKDLFPNGNLVEEVKSLKQKIVDLEEELENQIEAKKELQEKMSQVLRDYESSKQKNVDISSQMEDAHWQVIEKENQCNCYLRAIEELESEITKLERVMEKHEEEFSEATDTVHKLETQVKSLENDLQNKTQANEDSLREIINAKIEQEQRTLQAEEELRKAKMNHAAAAQRIQVEFQKLSTELASKFDENEKLTLQAQTEACELCLQVKTLEEQLRIANEEFRLMKDDYDIEVEKLSEQLTEKDKQLEQLLVKLQEERKVLESAKQKHEWKSNTLSRENESLRVEMERLTEENYHLSKKSKETINLRAELEVMKISTGQTKRLVEIAKKEREDLEKKYASLSREAQESLKELNNTRSSSEKKNAMIEIFQSQLQQLRAQHDAMKEHLSVEKLQNENLKEQLRKKDQEISYMEEKYKNRKDSNASNEKVKQSKIIRSTRTPPEIGSNVEEKRHNGRKVQPESLPSQNGIARGSGKSRKEPCSEKNQKVSDAQSVNEGELTVVLLSEVAELKEKNKSMESELKEMQEKYSEVSLRFAEVEGERQQLIMTVRNLRNGQKK